MPADMKWMSEQRVLDAERNNAERDADLIDLLAEMEQKRKMLKSICAHLQSRNESKVLQDGVRGLARGLSSQIVDILKARFTNGR